ncbi:MULTISPECIES: patatin-like phospholipase family protein [unclassified Thioalkalivibrio]|uniref:patatin-like phospholipase family protein n=1 Tax=unclassified Thioalkalivibrio TaxID=2621013 RepID=UPI000373AE7E|nr:MULTISPECIES: patatin-like phospholipase family protein [unclassified Thioalkalivibrio]
MKPLLVLLLALLLSAAPAPLMAERADSSSPTIGLALGSGGAGGLAHIAILQVFDDLEMHPDRITGTSIGAVIGGLYAAGLDAEEILDLFDDFAGSELDALTGLARSDIKLLDLVPLRLGRNALFDSSEFLRFLADHTEARDFDDLRIPFSVVATDFRSGDSVVIDEGDLFAAIGASMAVPGLFEPVQHGDDRYLIDGGASNPLPYDLLQGQYDYVIAVDVSGNGAQNDTEDIGITDLLFKSFSIMQGSIIRHMTRLDPPDLYLVPDTGGIRLLHFNRIDEILEKAQPAADELREQLESRGHPL